MESNPRIEATWAGFAAPLSGAAPPHPPLAESKSKHPPTGITVETLARPARAESSVCDASTSGDNRIINVAKIDFVRSIIELPRPDGIVRPEDATPGRHSKNPAPRGKSA